jgi:hypothetical protein
MSSQGDGAERLTVDLTEVSKGADVPEAPTGGPFRRGDLVDRDEPFTVRYVDPKGELHESDMVSRIMTKDDRDRQDRLVAMAAGGPVDHLPGQGWRMISCFRVAIQIVAPPKWLLEAIQEDDDLLVKVMGVLEAHRLTYFRGDDGEGGHAPLPTHVEVVPHSKYLREPQQQ